MKNIIKTIKNIININQVLTRLEKVEGEVLPKKEETKQSNYSLFSSLFLWDFSGSSLLERVELIENKIKVIESYLRVEIVKEEKESKYVAKKVKKSK